MRIDPKPAITLEEARKLLGKDGELLTDEEVKKIVEDFDIIAQHLIKLVPLKRKLVKGTD
jgi:hypothetical protein